MNMRLFRQSRVSILALLCLASAIHAAEFRSVVDLVHRSREEVGRTNLPAARALAQQAVATDPAYIDAWKQLGRMDMLMGHSEEALPSFDLALELQADDEDIARWRPALLRDLGWTLWARGDIERSVARFDEALQGGRANRKAVVRQVFAALAESERPELAPPFLSKWSDAGFEEELGLEFYKRDRIAIAGPALYLAWASGHNKAHNGLLAAYLQSLQGHCEELTSLLSAFVESLSNAAPEEVELARESLHLCPGDETDALRIQLRAISAPQYSEGVTEQLERIARARQAARDYGQAVRLYFRVFERDPNRRSYIRAATAVSSLRGNEAAVEFLKGVQARAGAEAVRAGTSALLADLAGNAEQARALYQRSIELDPEQPDARYELFSALMKLGRRDEARKQVDWFVSRLEQGDRSVQTPLAEMWGALDDLQESLDIWTALAERYPGSAYYSVEQARALYRMGRADEALAQLTNLTSRVEDAQAFELSAEILLKLQRPEEAREAAERALNLEYSPALLRLREEATRQN